MTDNEQLRDRVREALGHLEDVVEKTMFGGVCFMVNGKMCMGVSNRGLMCRVGTDRFDEAVERNGARPMMMKDRVMNGYIFVDETGYKSKKDFDYWVKLCLDFNPLAKAAKKKKTS